MKSGKTTLLSQFPKSLILAFEPGTNALTNVLVQQIQGWTDFKTVIKQLKNPKAQERYDFIGIDTADVAYEFCEKYICAQVSNDSNTYTNIGDIPYGKGYSLCKREFSNCFREIAQMGYGIFFISHSAEKTFKNEKGEDYVQIVPALPTRPYDIVNKMVDIIGYLRNVTDTETGESTPYLFLRGDDRFLAGSRFKYMEPRIECSYESLAQAFQEAVEKQAAATGTQITQDKNSFYQKEEKRDFNEAMDEARQLWKKLIEGNEEAAIRIMDYIEKIFGKRMKLSETQPSQQDLLELVIEEMREM